MSSEANLYWHFCQVDNEGELRLGYADGENQSALGDTVTIGETLRIEGKPVLCERGYHASKKLWGALNYARGSKLALCRVTLGGTVLHDDDKSVASERTVVSMLDADTTEKLLRDWARWCALQVIHLWDAPDIVRQYLETGDESIRAAAWDAAWDAARAAAWAAEIEKYAAELERRALEASGARR